MTEQPLLAVEDLQTHYPITEGLLRREAGRVRAVDGVSFELQRGEVLGLVGESGSGKTTTAHSILGLETPTGGEIRFDGTPISDHTAEQRRAFQRRAQLIVQDPNEAFNPRMTVGQAVAEPLVIHGMDDQQRRRSIVTDLLERVGLSERDAARYPHEFSGGEKQRLAIARALVLNPDLLVADEPTSALDGRVQSEILSLLTSIRREFDISILFISHDIDVVRRFCDRVAVMYLGEIVEKGSVQSVLSDPAHPYTRLLCESVPSLDPSDRSLPRPLTDTIPDPSEPPSGCRFHTRCPALIPPEDIELSESGWRAVAAFRMTIQTGELPPAIDLDTPGKLDSATVRSAFDLPETIPDESVDTVVEQTIDDLLSGDLQAAGQTVSEGLPTVCARESPSDSTANDGEESIADARLVRCHRYDGQIEAPPPEADH